MSVVCRYFRFGLYKSQIGYILQCKNNNKNNGVIIVIIACKIMQLAKVGKMFSN